MAQEKQPAGAGELTYRIVGHAIDQTRVTRPLFAVIVIAALACLFDAGDAYLVGFAIPGIAKEFSLRPETIGLIASSTLVGMTIGSFFWGWIADKMGRKVAFTLTILMFTLFSGVSGLAFSVSFLLGARFLTGAGIGGSIPVDGTILAEYAPARIRGFCIGTMHVAFPTGLFLASACGLLVLPRWGWRGLFFAGVIPALLTFWVRRNVPESPRWLANRGRFAEARKALNYLEISDEAIERSRIAVQNEPPVPMVPPAVYGDLFKPEMRRRTIHTSIIWFFPLMCSWAMNLWMPKLFVQLYGLPLQKAVGYALYFSLISISARLVVYFLSEKLGRKIPIILGFSLAGITLFFAGSAATATQFFAIACVYQYFMESGLIGIGIYTPEVYPVHIRALGSSWAMGLGRIGGAVGGYLVGAFLGAGHVHWVWGFMGAGPLFAGLVTILMGIDTKGRNLEELNREESARGALKAKARAAAAAR